MENWKPVKGYEGLYEVSDTGKVRSKERTVIRKNGAALPLKGKELFFTISKIDEKGHLPRASVQLWKNNSAKLVHVHKIVAEAFIPNPENKPTVNHIDGNPLNNSKENLEWATYSENQIHAYRNGLMRVKRNPYPSNCRKVMAYNEKTGVTLVRGSINELARELGVNKESVRKCAAENEKVVYRKCRGYIVTFF